MPSLKIDLVVDDKGQVVVNNAKVKFGELEHAVESTHTKLAGLGDMWGKLAALTGGALSVAGIVNMITSTAKAKDELVEMAEKVGIAAASLQAYDYAGKIVGTSTEALASSLAKLSKAMAGDNKGIEALGLKVKDAAGQFKGADVMMGEIADKFAAMQDGTGKTALAMEIFGKSGKEVIPVLNLGSDGLARMREEMRGLGYEMDETKLKRMADLYDQFDRIKTVAGNLASAILADLTPGLEGMTKAFLDASSKSDGFKSSAEAVAYVLKGIAATALGVVASFDLVGTAVGEGVGALSKLGSFKGGSWDQLMEHLFGKDRELTSLPQKFRMYGDMVTGLFDNISKAQEKAAGGKGGKTPAPFMPDDKAAKAVHDLTAEFESWKNTIDDLNPSLSEQSKKLADIEAQAARFKSGGIDEKQVDMQVAIARTNLEMQAQFNLVDELVRKYDKEAAAAYDNAAEKAKDYLASIDKLESTYEGIRAAVVPATVAEEEFNASMTALDKMLEAFPSKAEEIRKVMALLTGKYGRETAEAKADTLAEQAAYYAEIMGFEDTWYKKQLEHIAALRDAEIAAGKDRTAANAKAAQAQADAEVKLFSAKTTHYAQLAAGAADFFEGLGRLYDKDSKQQKSMHDAAMAFSIAYQAVLAAQAVKAAVVAIANQGSGDPYSAWARIGAMASAMGGLLATIGESVNYSGGSGSGSAKASITPGSTVLGGSGEASGSVQNALEILGDVSAESHIELVGIHRSMKELNQNITGLVRSVLQGGDLATLTAGIDTGGASAWSSYKAMTGSLGSLMANAMHSVPGLSQLYDFFDSSFGGLVNTFSDLLGGIGKSESKITGQGIEIAATTLGDALNEVLIRGSYYAVVNTKSKSWLGKVSRDVDIYTQAMDEDTTRLFSAIYDNLAEGLVGIAEALGQDAQKVRGYAIPPQQINLQGLDSSEINEAITAWMNEVADTAASALFGNFLEQFQQIEEGLYETAIRIVADKEIILDALSMTGQAFRGTTEDAIYFAESLIAMAGDLDALQGYFSKYFETFLTAEQQHAYVADKLTGILALQNIALPDTRAGYVSLVESLDLMTASGQAAYYTLMALSDTADNYYAYLEDAAEAAEEPFQQLVETAQSAADSALSAAENALKAAFGAEKEGLTAEYNAQLDVLNDNLATAKDTLADLTSLVDKLTQAKESMRLEDEKYLRGMYRWSMGKLGQMVTQSRAGKLPSEQALDTILPYLTSGDNSKYYSSAVDYQRDYWSVYNSLAELEDAAEKKRADAAETVAGIEDEIDVLKTNHEAELTALDKQLSALLGIDESVLSLADAIAQYLAAKDVAENPAGPVITGMYRSLFGRTPDAEGAAYWGMHLANGMSPAEIMRYMIASPEWSSLWGSNPIEGLYRSLLGRASDAEGYSFWKNAFDSGYSMDYIISQMMASEEYSKIRSARGYALGGIASGPESGYEATLHGTELVVSPRSAYPVRMGGGADEVTAQIKVLRSELRAQNARIEANTRKMAKILDRFDSDGMPGERVVA